MERKALVFVRKKFENQSVVGAEVGVAIGTNALRTLEAMPNLKWLYLIDPYQHYPEWTSTRAKDRRFWPEDLEITKRKAQTLLAPFKNKIRWVFKRFEDCTSWHVGPLDFIYIDGNHDYDFVFRDIVLARKFVKKGGVVSGHDFRPASFSQDSLEVCRAVRDYCKKHDIVFSHEYEDWWFIN